MSIRPTHHRILIQPDEQPEANGNILLPQHREYVATSGTVVAMGTRGSRVRWDARQRALQQAVEAVEKLTSHWTHERLSDGIPGVAVPVLKSVTSQLLKLIGSPDSVHEVAIGDRVAFDSESGLRLTQDGTEYLILDEDDVVVIVDEKESAA